MRMNVMWSSVLAIGCLFPCLAGATPRGGSDPKIDNERVVVWDVTWTKGQEDPTSKHSYDSVILYTAGGQVKVVDETGATHVATHKAGDVLFLKKGSRSYEVGITDANAPHSVIVELKDNPVPPIENTSGYPDAFPRPHIKKKLENDRVLVWDYRWNPREPTPMHFHSKDVVVVFLENGVLTSTTPDGKRVDNPYSAGQITFNLSKRTHTENLTTGTQHAMMVELK